MNLLNKEIKKLPGYPFDRLRSLLANTTANSEVIDITLDDQGAPWESKTKPKHKFL